MLLAYQDGRVGHRQLPGEKVTDSSKIEPERAGHTTATPRMARTQSQYRWAVFNQSQSPDFQRMIERLSEELGPCLLFTGMPFPVEHGQVVTEAGPKYDRRAVPRRAWTWFAFAIASFLRGMRLSHSVFFFAVTNPPILPEIAWLLHKLKGNAYGLLIWDIYPDHMVKLGWISETGPVAGLWNRLNRRVLLDARVVITLGESMAEALRAQVGRTPTRFRIQVIPNWADTDLLQPMCKAENPFAAQYDQIDKVTVLYSGNMGHTHGLEMIVEAAKALEKDSRVLFLLIGDGLGRRQIEEKVTALGLGNVRLLPRQPWNVLPYSLATGDIAVVTQAPGSEHLSIPSKVYSMMAAGCALVACTHEESDLAHLVQANEVGVVCPHGDAHALAEAISMLAGNDTVLSGYRTRARKLAVERYSPGAVFPHFCDVLVPAMSNVGG